ncbi:MAG: 3'-5' exonuclease [Synergistaceae bacterium]|nr:3'-5' exonuclease [Synergistaceae bacterium]
MNVAVFDLETNGMAGASAVSASSIVFDTGGAILDVFNRFYLPSERIDPQAVRVHGLTLERLAALREHIPSTPYFAEDWPDLLDFWEKWSVGGVVVHNLSFDAAFLPEIAQSAVRWWCSMKGLTAYCAIPKRFGRAFKWPRLGEAADVVCNGPNALSPPEAAASIENSVGEGFAQPHVSLFDCFELYRVVSRVYLHHRDLIKFEPFTVPFCPPSRQKAGAAYVAAESVSREDPFISDVLAYEQKVRSVISNK